jgi:hypothetical protein
VRVGGGQDPRDFRVQKTSATRATRNKPAQRDRAAKAPAKPKTAGPNAIGSLAELAALVERDKGTVSRWLQRPDWPFAKRPPFERTLVPKILRWVAEFLAPARDPDLPAKPGQQPAAGGRDAARARHLQLREQKLQEEVRRVTAQAATLETALARERGELVEAAEVEREWAGIGATVRNAFQALPSQLVPLALAHGMPHAAAPLFQEQAAAAIAAILRRLSTDEAEGRGADDDDAGDDGQDAAARADVDDDPGEGEALPGAQPPGTMDAQPMGGALPDPQPG